MDTANSAPATAPVPAQLDPAQLATLIKDALHTQMPEGVDPAKAQHIGHTIVFGNVVIGNGNAQVNNSGSMWSSPVRGGAGISTTGENSPVNAAINTGDANGEGSTINVNNGDGATTAPGPQKAKPAAKSEPEKENPKQEDPKQEDPKPKQPERKQPSPEEEREWQAGRRRAIGTARVPGLGADGIYNMVGSDLGAHAQRLIEARQMPEEVREVALRYAEALHRNDRAGGFRGGLFRRRGDRRREGNLRRAEEEFLRVVGDTATDMGYSPGMTLLHANAAYRKVTMYREALAHNDAPRWYHRLGRAAIYAGAIAAGGTAAWLTGGLGLPLALTLLTKVGIGMTSGYGVATYAASRARHDRTSGEAGAVVAWDSYRNISAGMAQALMVLDPRNAGHIAAGRFDTIGDLRRPLPGGNPLGLDQVTMDGRIEDVWWGGASVRNRGPGGLSGGIALNQPPGLSDESMRRVEFNRHDRHSRATKGAIAGGVAALVLGVVNAAAHGGFGGHHGGTGGEAAAPGSGDIPSPGGGEGQLPPDVLKYLQDHHAYTVADRLLDQVGSQSDPNDLIQRAIDRLNATYGNHLSYTPGPDAQVLYDGHTMGAEIMGDTRFALNMAQAQLVAGGYR